jgi:hypothetical protein
LGTWDSVGLSIEMAAYLVDVLMGELVIVFNLMDSIVVGQEKLDDFFFALSV